MADQTATSAYEALRECVAEGLWRFDFPHAVREAWTTPDNAEKATYRSRADAVLDTIRLAGWRVVIPSVDLFILHEVEGQQTTMEDAPEKPD